MLRSLQWLVPGAPILGLAIALAMGVGPDSLLPELTRGYPWVVLAVALLLAVLFQRSRVAVAVVCLALAHLVTSGRLGGFTGFYLAGGVLVLILGGLVLFKDRGVSSVGGMLQAGGAVTAAGLAALFLVAVPEEMAALLGAMPLPPALTVWSGLPQPVFLAFAGALAASFVSVVRRGGAVEKGILWSLPPIALALYFSTDPALVTLYLMAAGLTLGLSVVETSYAMAYRDDLTALPARRALMRDLESLTGTYSVAMVDVDHFKSFNDRHGHDVGDQVLRMVAGRLAQAPAGGRAYRYGGEEFTLLYPGKTREETLPHLEAVRRAVEEATFTLRGWRRPRRKPVNPRSWKEGRGGGSKLLSVTVSIGLAESSGKDTPADMVLKKADEALYRAKKSGRNRVSK